MAATPLALILGSGPRVGASVAKSLAAEGYKIAVVSRKASPVEDSKGYLYFQADFTKPETVPMLFEQVTKQAGTAPSVVVYNAAALTPSGEQGSPLSIPAASFISDLNINTVTPYMAAQEAMKGWKTLPEDQLKTFIYTGNKLNTVVKPVPLFLTLGVGKAASAYWVGTADSAYAANKYRFFYADERHSDGKDKGLELDGEAHGEFFASLSKHPADVPWDATFVKGKGYVKF